MVETFVDYALGPHGRYISELYMENQTLVNTLVVGMAIFKLFYSKRKQRPVVETSTASKS